MKVKELMAMLANVDPEAELLVCDNGSILNTKSAQATHDYNVEWVAAGEFFILNEFFIVTEEWK